jgi:hypothetical protein
MTPIANIAPILNDSQIERVFQGILENDQIRYSWSAQYHLINFIAMYGKRVHPNLLKRVQEEFPLSDLSPSRYIPNKPQDLSL